MDIEDLHKLNILPEKDTNQDINKITKKYLYKNNNELINEDFKDCTNIKKGLPQTKRIFIKTFGCPHNVYDGEYIEDILVNEGYYIIKKEADKYNADVWVLNGCTVKDPSQFVVDKSIKEAEEKNIKIILAGCVPQPEPNTYSKYSILGIQQLDRIGEIVEEICKGNTVQLIKHRRKYSGNNLSLPKIRKNNLIEIIPINTGYLNDCTYCKTKFACDNFNSNPIQDILNRIDTVIQEGVVEIWLTSEDIGTWGIEIGKTIPDLLWNIVNLLEKKSLEDDRFKKVMIKLGMTNPNYIKEHKKELAKIFKQPQFYAFIHIPIQSGSNDILKKMKREYTREDFENLVSYLTEEISEIHIETDVICGFPYETDENFDDTLTLIEKFKPITLNISQYFARKGTSVARMPQIDHHKKKSRSENISELFESYQPYSRYIGEIFKVICTDISAQNNYYVAHNKYYHHILIPMKDEYLGETLIVQIEDYGKFYMKAKVIDFYSKNKMNEIINELNTFKVNLFLLFIVFLVLLSVIIYSNNYLDNLIKY